MILPPTIVTGGGAHGPAIISAHGGRFFLPVVTARYTAVTSATAGVR
jgi:hypothetical protein